MQRRLRVLRRGLRGERDVRVRARGRGLRPKCRVLLELLPLRRLPAHLRRHLVQQRRRLLRGGRLRGRPVRRLRRRRERLQHQRRLLLQRLHQQRLPVPEGRSLHPGLRLRGLLLGLQQVPRRLREQRLHGLMPGRDSIQGVPGIDGQRFDDLTRALAAGATHRADLKRLAAAAAGGLLGLSGRAGASRDDDRIVSSANAGDGGTAGANAGGSAVTGGDVVTGSNVVTGGNTGTVVEVGDTGGTVVVDGGEVTNRTDIRISTDSGSATADASRGSGNTVEVVVEGGPRHRRRRTASPGPGRHLRRAVRHGRRTTAANRSRGAATRRARRAAAGGPEPRSPTTPAASPSGTPTRAAAGPVSRPSTSTAAGAVARTARRASAAGPPPKAW